MTLVVCTAYTSNGGYEDFVPRWREGVAAFLPGARQVAQPLGEIRSWIEAAHRKPEVILDVLEQTPGEVLWIDVDAEVVAPVPLFEGWPGPDLGVRYRPSEYSDHVDVMTGTCYVRRSARASALLRAWAEASRGSKLPRNQAVLEAILDAHLAAGLEVLDLPPEYAWIAHQGRDRARHPDRSPRIVHALHGKTQVHRRVH